MRKNIPRFSIPLQLHRPRLSGSQLKSDFIAALVVTAVAVPESLGFAAIVGLPVQTGLYCAMLAPIVFAILTSSRHLVVGADSATAALVASGASSLALVGSAAYPEAVATVSFVAAILLICMSIARFGFLTNFISKPVLIGFLGGVGLQLIVGKLPEMLGLEAHGSFLYKINFIFQNFGDIHTSAATVGLFTLCVILLVNRRGLPGPLFGLIAAIIFVEVGGLRAHGVQVVGSLPAGLPDFILPNLSFDAVSAVLPSAAAIAAVVLAQSSAVIRSYANKYDEPVSDNRDLFALGMANISSSLLHGFTINGSPPRTAIGDTAGGRTQMVNVFMAMIIVSLVVFAAGIFSYVPIPALGAIVFSIGLHLFSVSKLRDIWRVRSSEFFVALIALVSVAIWGVQYGVLVAIVASIIERLRRQYKPNDYVLIRDELLAHSWAEDRIDYHHRYRSRPSGLLVYRFGGSIFFENVTYFSERVYEAIATAKKPVTRIIIDAGAINDIDYTAADALARLYYKLHADNIKLVLAHVPPQLKETLKRYGLLNTIGRRNIFPTLKAAIEASPHARRTSVEMIKRLELPLNEHVVIGGGVLETLHLRETSDIDVVVSRRVYEHYKNLKWKEYVQDDGKKVLSHNGYIFMESWVGRSLKHLIKRSFVIEGVRFMGLDDLIACKSEIGRDKDRSDVDLLKEYQREEKAKQRKTK